MNELDRQIRITLHNLATLQAAKIVQLEQQVEKLEAENKRTNRENHELKLKYADRVSGSKKEAQA